MPNLAPPARYGKLVPCAARCGARTLNLDGLCQSCRDRAPGEMPEEVREEHTLLGHDLTHYNNGHRLRSGFASLSRAGR